MLTSINPDLPQPQSAAFFYMLSPHHNRAHPSSLQKSYIETEKFVGSYRCDILGKDELTGKIVLIENQLEPTNHDHLGKIITYASGLDASVVIWIVESARDEHASAIEFLPLKYTTIFPVFI